MNTEELSKRRALLKEIAVSNNFRILTALLQSENALTTGELIDRTGIGHRQGIWVNLSSLKTAGILTSETAYQGHEHVHYIAPDASPFIQMLLRILFAEDTQLERMWAGSEASR